MNSRESDLDGLPTRYIGSILVRGIYEFLVLAVQKLDLSVEEVAIVALVSAESTRPIVEEVYLTQVFGYEGEVLPDLERPPVKLKFIAGSLGMNRETCRRRLIGLVERGFLVKRGGGYIFPQQIGDNDFSEDLRRNLAGKFLELRKYIARAQISRDL